MKKYYYEACNASEKFTTHNLGVLCFLMSVIVGLTGCMVDSVYNLLLHNSYTDIRMISSLHIVSDFLLIFSLIVLFLDFCLKIILLKLK